MTAITETIKARPILFSGPMVRALMDGRKTQTRRVIKPQPPMNCVYSINGAGDAAICTADGDKVYPSFVPPTPRSKDHRLPCPYGKPGDLLWVRETWAIASRASDVAKVYYRAHERASHTEFHEYVPVENIGKHRPTWPNWKPSIFMPRWASRLTLEITNVRVERLQDITATDAIAEGATCRPKIHGYGKTEDGWSMNWPSQEPSRGWGDVSLGSARHAFGAFINELHGGKNWNCKAELPLWEQNAWVWALSFRVHLQNVDSLIALKETV